MGTLLTLFIVIMMIAMIFPFIMWYRLNLKKMRGTVEFSDRRSTKLSWIISYSIVLMALIGVLLVTFLS